MLLFYMFKAYQTLAVKSRLTTIQHEWSKVEPKVTAAQKQFERTHRHDQHNQSAQRHD